MRFAILRRAFRRYQPALKIGVGLTAVWGIGLVAYSARNLKAILALEPNEFGDFLAGAFAPLAFLWLLVAVLLQKNELMLQRQELRHSRNALEAQAAETRALVEENKRAVEVSVATLEMQRNKEDQLRLLEEIDHIRIRFLSLERLADLNRVSDGSRLLALFAGVHQQADAIGLFRKVSGDLKKAIAYAKGCEVKLTNNALVVLLEIAADIYRISGEVDKDKYPGAWNRFEALRLKRVKQRIHQLSQLISRDTGFIAK